MQASDSTRHVMLVRGVAVLCVVFTLVALSCRPLPANAQAHAHAAAHAAAQAHEQANALRGDRSGEFGTSVTVVPSADGKVPTVRFDWVVPAGTQLIPGDNVTISLPDWLEAVHQVQQDQRSVRCTSARNLKSVTCTFVDVSTPSADVSGSVEVPVRVTHPTDSAPVRWGGRVFDLRQHIPATTSTTTTTNPNPNPQPADIVEAAHPQSNNRWDVVVSARQSRSGRVVVESSQADQDFVEVRRRDAGPAYDRGTWEDAASIRCQPGGDLHAQQLGCAQRVFLANSAGEAYLPGAAGERVSVRSRAGSLAVVIDNPVRGAAYRVRFASSLPDPVIYVNGVEMSAPANRTKATTNTTDTQTAGSSTQRAWYLPLLAVVPLIPWAFGALVPHQEEVDSPPMRTPVTSSALAAPVADTTVTTAAEQVDRSHAANTGASIVGLALLLLLVILGGTAFVLRGRATTN